MTDRLQYLLYWAPIVVASGTARAVDPVRDKYPTYPTKAIRFIMPYPVCGEPSADGNSAKLWTQDDTGTLTLSATAEIA